MNKESKSRHRLSALCEANSGLKAEMSFNSGDAGLALNFDVVFAGNSKKYSAKLKQENISLALLQAMRNHNDLDLALALDAMGDIFELVGNKHISLVKG